MKKSIFALVCGLFLFTGCFGTQVSPDEQLVKDGFKGLVGVSSYNFELLLDGAFDALQGENLVKFSIDGLLAGKVDSADKDDPKFSMSLSGSGSVDSAEPQSLAGELRLNKQNLFFKIASLPALDSQQLPQELVDQFVGKWWQVELPEDSQAENNPLMSFSNVDDLEIENYKKLLDKYNFFTDLKAEGTDIVKGEESYKYSMRLNRDDVRAFLIENREYLEEPMTAEEIEGLDKVLNTMTFSGYVYVGTESKKLNKISGELYVKDVSEEQVKEGNFDLDFAMWDFGKPVSLEIPEDAELFNPFMLLGGLPETEVPVDVPAE